VGLPALRHDATHGARRPHLRLLPSPKKGAGRRSRDELAAARAKFRLFVVVTALVALLGVGRVWLSVSATTVSLEANELRARIETERYEGDMLEARQSSLGSPSRIRAIAGKAMGMAPAESVSYLDLTKQEKKSSGDRKPATEVSKASVAGESSLQRALGNIMDLTAGEAQVLLVGDVGLASTR